MSTPDRATAYAEEVRDGLAVAGPLVRAACARHLRDLEQAEEKGWVWSPDTGMRPIRFIEHFLTLSERHAGQPFLLHPFQSFGVQSLYGWLNTDGSRRFRRAYWETAKGSGKSPLAAALGLYMLMGDGEGDPQVYATASKLDQAMVVFNDAVRLVERSDVLTRQYVQPQRIVLGGNIKNTTILWRPEGGGGGEFKPMPHTAAKSGSGLRPSFVICDELHEWEHPDLLEIMELGFKFRRQPLLFMITNSGKNITGVCYQEHKHAKNILLNKVEDDLTFALIASLDEEDDPFEDLTCLEKANPLIGTIVEWDYLEGVFKQARHSPEKRNNIMRLYAGTWTFGSDSWLVPERILECVDPKLTWDDFKGREAIIALDLSSTVDLTSYCVLALDDPQDDDEGPRYIAGWKTFVPAEGLDKKEYDDKMPYAAWAETGHLVVIPGARISFAQVCEVLMLDMSRVKCLYLVIDPWRAEEFQNHLWDENVEVEILVHPQRLQRRRESPLQIPESINALESLILERRVRFMDDPVAKQALLKAHLERSPDGRRVFAKEHSYDRIDPALAVTMASGASLYYYETSPDAFWRSREEGGDDQPPLVLSV